MNSYSALSTGMAGPATTSFSLISGQTYTLTVSGTYSAYNQTLMGGAPGTKVCGTPVLGNGHLEGQDAVFVFAKPKRIRTHCPKMPFAHQNFVISTNGTSGPFVYQAPDGGVPSGPSSKHTYTYTITGAGQPASFGLMDSNTTDNVGVLHISVHAS